MGNISDMSSMVEHRHQARPDDTSPEAWRILANRWRTMSPTDKLAVCDQMSIDLIQLAETGIRATEGNVSPERMRYLLTKRRYGATIAEQAFGPEPSH